MKPHTAHTTGRRWIIATLLAALLLAACGEDEPPAESDAGDAAGDTQGETDGDTETDSDDDGSESGNEGAIGGELVIASWGGVFTETTKSAFADPFASEFGVDVKFADAPGEHVANLTGQHETGRVQWDVIDSLDEAAALEAWEQGLLEPLSDDLMAKLQDVSIDGAVREFGVLQSSISDIFACNSEEAERCPTTPEEFWDVENFPGPRSLQDDPLPVIAMALAADGVPYDEIFPADLDRAFAKLEEIRPHVRLFWSSGDESQQAFRSGEVVMGTIWNGRAKVLLEEGLPLEISWDGAAYTPAYTVMVKDSPNPEAAEAYLEWYATHPEAQAEWASALSYGVSNPKALDALSEDVADLLPESHMETSVVLDSAWMRDNRDEVVQRWRQFTAGG